MISNMLLQGIVQVGFCGSVLGIEWKKPTITFYHERLDKPETDAFAVVKAKSIAIETAQDGGFKGEIDDFFVLMGDLDQVSTARGKQDRYVLCWFDDAVEDFRKGSRRLNNVTFPSGLTEMAIEGKRTYKTSFHAQLGKIS